jgi:hypothetical protein
MRCAVRAGRATRALVLVLWLVATGACAGLPHAGDRSAACWPQFPYESGWLGGDGGYSIPLSPTRTLWLLGDTFIGADGQADRAGAAFIHNSIAISECREDGRFDVRYVWGRGRDGAPRAFLERDGEGWWWLFGGFLHEGHLYVGLLEVEKSEPRGPLNMPFRFSGTALARIDDPHADPETWRPEVLRLSRSANALPVGAMLIHGEWLHLFAFVDAGEGRFPRVLLRLPLARLTDGTRDVEPFLETLDASGAWLPGFAPERALVLMDDNATEMSVRHHPELGKWIALYNYPNVGAGFPRTPTSDAVYARSADRLEGPWSEPELIFRVPELAEGHAPPPDPNMGCYAAKEHPGFSLPGSITFTYVCNLFTGRGEDPYVILGRLARRMDLYRPVAVTVSLPFPAAPPPSDPGG